VSITISTTLLAALENHFPHHTFLIQHAEAGLDEHSPLRGRCQLVADGVLLGTSWPVEVEQDLCAMHGHEGEAVLLAMVIEQVAFELTLQANPNLDWRVCAARARASIGGGQ
jgi:hypothetical protein